MIVREIGVEESSFFWLRSTKPFNMLSMIRSHASPRKLRLFAYAAACEEWEHDSLSTEYRAYLLQLMEYLARGEPLPDGITLPNRSEFNLHPEGQDETMKAVLWAAPTGHHFSRAHLLRDIFSNPFRPVAFDPNWRTSTVVSLARSMYESRDFSAMPILSDALQDAGCDHADILDHCRGSGPHVRGCWVVDVALGNA
jgi:hypothetical protein